MISFQIDIVPLFITAIFAVVITWLIIRFLYSKQHQKLLNEAQLAAEKAIQLEQLSRELSAKIETQEAEKIRLTEKVQNLEKEAAVISGKQESLEENLNRLKKEKSEIESKLINTEANLSGVKVEREKYRTESVAFKESYEKEKLTREALQKNMLEVTNENTALKTSQQERDQSHQEQLKNFSEQKAALSKEFENLANKIFTEKGKNLTETNKDSIDLILKPLKEKIDGFQKRVNEVNDISIKGQTELQSEIKKVMEMGIQISSEANNLTSALKGNKKVTGNWGEIQLERSLQLAGLLEGDHYSREENYKDEDRKNKRPDFVVKLPDGKHIILDSKTSLVAYEQAVSAETEQELKQALDAHVQAIKNHIDGLASKNYTSLIGMKSPHFVLMFIPIEPAYIEALKHDKGLFDYGYRKNIVMLSHTTLMPVLSTVANLWKIEQSNLEAREIANKSGDIFNQVCLVSERIQKMGNTIQTLNNHYNSTVTSIIGQQGLYGKVERFKQLSGKANKTMPELEVSSSRLELNRLDLVVEALPAGDEEEL